MIRGFLFLAGYDQGGTIRALLSKRRFSWLGLSFVFDAGAVGNGIWKIAVLVMGFRRCGGY